jgi:hypothetical protein
VRVVMLRSYVRAFYLQRRKRELERALGGYPLYDPPHKIEERLLTKEKAEENFAYFMGVRLERVAYLQGWLHRHFGVTATLDEKGVRALSRWGNDYTGFLLVKRANGRATQTILPTIHRGRARMPDTTSCLIWASRWAKPSSPIAPRCTGLSTPSPPFFPTLPK